MLQRPQFLESLGQLWPVESWRDQPLLIAVSGGADSVALLRAIHSLAENPQLIHVAHYNHGWRGPESDGDQQFVDQLCQTLGVRLQIGCAKSTKHSEDSDARTEEAARQQRYEFLTHSARQVESRYILTAHTASDRVETMLHNLFRGTGLAGVCAPAFVRPHHDDLLLVRPLLNCFRDDVQAYLDEIQQSHRNDATNDDIRFRRNFLRQSVLPLLRQQYGPQVDQHLISFSQIAEQVVAVQQALADQYWRRAQEFVQSSVGKIDPPALGLSFIQLPTASGLPVAWPVALQALQQAWRSQGWPLQGMTRWHWDQVRALWSEHSAPPGGRPTASVVHQIRRQLMLPGKIGLSVQGNILLLVREIPISS